MRLIETHFNLLCGRMGTEERSILSIGPEPISLLSRLLSWHIYN